MEDCFSKIKKLHEMYVEGRLDLGSLEFYRPPPKDRLESLIDYLAINSLVALDYGDEKERKKFEECRGVFTPMPYVKDRIISTSCAQSHEDGKIFDMLYMNPGTDFEIWLPSILIIPEKPVTADDVRKRKDVLILKKEDSEAIDGVIETLESDYAEIVIGGLWESVKGATYK